MPPEQLDALSEKLRPQLEAAKATVKAARDGRDADNSSSFDGDAQEQRAPSTRT